MRIDVLGVGFDNLTMQEAVARGAELLEQEGCPRKEGVLTVGWAVKARRRDPIFLREPLKMTIIA